MMTVSLAWKRPRLLIGLRNQYHEFLYVGTTAWSLLGLKSVEEALVLLELIWTEYFGLSVPFQKGEPQSFQI